jgi:hypothetical protein
MQTHAENACRNAALVVSVHNVTTILKLEFKKNKNHPANI